MSNQLSKYRAIAIFKKTGFLILIVMFGLGIGYGIQYLSKEFKTNYVEGNYTSHFSDSDIRVIVYGTTDCSFCKKTRSYLQEKNVRFINVNVNAASAATSMFKSLGVTGVPVVIIGNRLINGYYPNVFDNALGVLEKAQLEQAVNNNKNIN
ncbi:MAG: glutaredoxin family protein [Undibacterium sp.]|nr:glutaredoxin family protein [Undibacterium sp.]